MNTKIGSKTFDTAGGVIIANLPFTPTEAEFSVAGTNSSFNDYVHYSEGATDGTFQYAHGFLKRSGYEQTITSTSKVVKLLGVVSGNIEEILAVEFVEFATNAIKLNVVKANPDYQVMIKLRA